MAVIDGLNAVLALRARIKIAEDVREMVFNFSHELARTCREAIEELETEIKGRA